MPPPPTIPVDPGLGEGTGKGEGAQRFFRGHETVLNDIFFLGPGTGVAAGKMPTLVPKPVPVPVPVPGTVPRAPARHRAPPCDIR